MLNESNPRWRRRLAQQVVAGRAVQTLKLVVPRVPERGPLRWYWLDGLAANLHESIMVTFTTLYALALGATATEIGWMSALGSLVAVMVLLPGARIAERIGNPHRLVVLAGGFARLMVLAMVLWPFLGVGGVWGIIAFATLRTLGLQLALPAWTAIAADIVPEEIRGRYFASRNLIMAIAAAVAVPAAGALISRIGGVEGFQLTFFLAFLLGVTATYFYFRIEVPRVEQPVVVRGKRLPLLKRLRRRPNFALFCVHAILWNFSLQIAGPFFNVYLVQELEVSTTLIGLLATVATLSSLPSQQIWGRIADRSGARRTLLISGAMIPLAPFAWMLVTAPWQVVLINLYSGFLWAGFNIATFNFLLAATPDERRPRYVALYNTLVGMANGVGAAMGGWVADTLSFQAIFFLSGVGRVAAMLLFFYFVIDPRLAPEKDLSPMPDEPGVLTA